MRPGVFTSAMLRRLFASIRKTLRALLRIAVPARGGKRDGRDEGPGGAGVTAPLKPRPPYLVGKEAKPIPAGDEDA